MSVFDVCGPRCVHEPGHDGPHSTLPLPREQCMVAEFNRVMGCERGQMPAIRAAELRARLILEEALETVEALLGAVVAGSVVNRIVGDWIESPVKCHRPDLVEAVDGLCDLQFVTYGAFDVLGVNARPYFDLVYAANMTKLTGPVDEHGKRLKPPGFVPPNEAIRERLIKDGWKP
jgi:predicted HAD superfamily Cof-like phosphohydrolase